MLTIKQTAKMFGLPKNFIRQAVLDGRIVHVKAGKNLAGKSQDAANETTELIQDSINRVETGASRGHCTS